jgi:hypothetical protein
VHFEISHDFDIPRDAVELAVLSPDLAKRMAPRLGGVEHIEQREHAMKDGVLDRVWSWKANVKIPSFATRYVTREMCAWDERSTYVKPAWRKYFEAKGTYELVALGQGRTRRVVRGDVEIRVTPLVRKMAERMIVGEVRKTFDAEAATLRDLATLG